MSIIGSLFDKHSFDNPKEWRAFEQRLNDATAAGHLQEIKPLSKDVAYNERWFQDTQSGEVYRYSAPEPGVGGGLWMKLADDELRDSRRR